MQPQLGDKTPPTVCHSSVHITAAPCMGVECSRATNASMLSAAHARTECYGHQQRSALLHPNDNCQISTAQERQHAIKHKATPARRCIYRTASAAVSALPRAR